MYYFGKDSRAKEAAAAAAVAAAKKAANAAKAAADRAALAKLPQVVEPKYVNYKGTLHPAPTLSNFRVSLIGKDAGIAPGSYRYVHHPLRLPYRVAATREVLEEPVPDYKDANPKRLKRSGKWKAVVVRTYERRPYKTGPDIIEAIPGFGYGLYRTEDEDVRNAEIERMRARSEPGAVLQKTFEEEVGARKRQIDAEVVAHQMKMVEEVMEYRRKLEELAQSHRKTLEEQVEAHRKKLVEEGDEWAKKRQEEMEGYKTIYTRMLEREASDELQHHHLLLKKREQRRGYELRKKQEEIRQAEEAAAAAAAAAAPLSLDPHIDSPIPACPHAGI